MDRLRGVVDCPVRLKPLNLAPTMITEYEMPLEPLAHVIFQVVETLRLKQTRLSRLDAPSVRPYGQHIYSISRMRPLVS